jgi:hypothetical protein
MNIMPEATDFTPDPLENLLRPLIVTGTDETLRRRLLDQTTRALRGRRRRRVVAWAAALSACYVAGVLTVYWLGPRRIERIEIVRYVPTPSPVTPTPAPVAPAPPTAKPASAVAMEWKAFDADQHRPELYRKAGDRYLREDADPASALRCYGQSLNGASDKDLAISPNDDYLLMLVKNARQKEKDHAKNGG